MGRHALDLGMISPTYLDIEAQTAKTAGRSWDPFRKANPLTEALTQGLSRKFGSVDSCVKWFLI
jgi:hypothetical protein